MKAVNLCFICCILMFLSCNSNNDKIESKVINDAFLQVIDTTVVYKFQSLLPAPNFEEIQANQNSLFEIAVNSNLMSLISIKEEINKALLAENQIDSKIYLAIINHNLNDTNQLILGKKWLSNHGRFTITYLNDNETTFGNNKKYLGQIRFYKPMVQGKFGLFAYIIHDNTKSWILKLVLLQEINEKWLVLKQLPLIVA